MPMIKPKFTLFQMKIESVCLHSPETNQAGFGICPKAFYAINVAMFIGKFILTVLDSVMLLIAKVHKAIITAPAIRMNNAFRVYTASDNALQGGSGTVWDYFCINASLPFKQAKNNCFSFGPSPSKSSDTASAKVTFINLNLARNW